MNLTTAAYWRHNDWRWPATLASLAVSVVCLATRPNLNDDAYTYVRIAEMVLEDGLAAAFDAYAWASYPALMAVLGMAGMDLFVAAHVINALFCALLVFAFLGIVRECSADLLVRRLAAACILLYPGLNEIRHYVIRDFGFWAFTLVAVLCLIRFRASAAMAQAAGFAAALLVATALRGEALAYLFLLPLSLLFGQWPGSSGQPGLSRTLLLGRLYLVSLAWVAAAGGLLALSGINFLVLAADFSSRYAPFLASLWMNSPEASAQLSHAIFGDYAAAFSERHLPLFLSAGYLAILLAVFATAITPPYLLPLAYGGLRQRPRCAPGAAATLVTAIAIHVVIALAFVFVTRYFATRYAILPALLAIVFLPLMLATWLRQAAPAQRRWLHAALLWLFLYCAVDSFYSFGKTKEHMSAAARWMAGNLPPEYSLLTNSHALAYDSGQVADYHRVPRKLHPDDLAATRAGDIIAIEWRRQVEGRLAEHFAAGQLELLAEFRGDGDDRVLIYRRLR